MADKTRRAKSSIVGDAGFAHERRVGGKALDVRKPIEREHAVQLCAVGEDPGREMVKTLHDVPFLTCRQNPVCGF